MTLLAFYALSRWDLIPAARGGRIGYQGHRAGNRLRLDYAQSVAAYLTDRLPAGFAGVASPERWMLTHTQVRMDAPEYRDLPVHRIFEARATYYVTTCGKMLPFDGSVRTRNAITCTACLGRADRVHRKAERPAGCKGQRAVSG